MDYDYERNIIGKIYSTSPTSSNSSSSASTHSSSIATTSSTNKPAATNQKANNQNNNQYISNVAMSASTSQIFATASSFNICQNDTVYYSRETIHLLAKFLSLNSENPIFRSLFAFAPDNLAWLWSFFEWEAPLDLNAIPNQEIYSPFKAVENYTINETELHEVNKFFLDAPLIQYKYREPIMIGDVYKFIEHVSKIEQIVVAKALFLIYFPRFAEYIDNPLKDVIHVQILKTNINIIKRVDDILISLMKSRYTNIDEYKQKIQRGIGLPSYIRTLLKENNYSYVSGENKPIELKQELKTNLQLKLINESITESSSPNLYSPFPNDSKEGLNQNFNIESEKNDDGLDKADEMIGNLSLSKENPNSLLNSEVSKYAERSDQSPSVFFPLNKTIDYMKLLEQSNRINDDLDHVSFDKKKALLCSKILNENIDAFYDKNNNSLLMNNIHAANGMNDYQLDPNYDEINTNLDNNNIYAGENDYFVNENVGENFAGCKETQLAAKYFDLICNNNQQSPGNLNLAQIRLPHLPHLNNFDSFSNGSSSALASPKQEANNTNSFYYGAEQKDKQYLNGSAMGKMSYSKLTSTTQNCLNTSTCLSPSSPKFISKPLMHTPKTPSNLGQYQEKASTDYSVWSNGGTPNTTKLTLPNSNRFYDAASVTPPPSATFRTSPLSVITNNYMLDISNSSGPIGSKINSPNCNELLSPTALYNKSQSNRLNEPYGLNSSLMQDDLNSYLKHQFYGSPVARLNRLNDYRSNPDKSNNPYSNLKTNRFNSNTDLNTNAFLQRNELVLDDLNSSKSPSSTSSGNQQQFNFTSRMKGNNNNNQNQHQHTWCGRLPPKTYSESSIYSRKVFLGGLPWDVNQTYLVQLLQKYGSVKLEVPGKDAKHPRVPNVSKSQERNTPGYVYIIYEHESAVQRMLADCRKDIKNGGEHYYYTIFIPPTANNNSGNNYYFNNNLSNKRGKAKEVEVIPWNQEDTSYVPQNKTSMLPAKIDAKTTIFVGALHGMLNAHGLAKVMSEIFGEVIHAGLDTDKYKYPIGSGRVTFRNRQSYVKAIKSKFVRIKANLEATDPSPKFEKTIQIDPYLEDAKCFKCNNRSYYFCRNECCLDYYCENCWKTNHDMVGNGEHQSLSRQNKPEQMNRIFR